MHGKISEILVISSSCIDSEQSSLLTSHTVAAVNAKFIAGEQGNFVCAVVRRRRERR